MRLEVWRIVAKGAFGVKSTFPAAEFNAFCARRTERRALMARSGPQICWSPSHD
jgi:hypothetical protein